MFQTIQPQKNSNKENDKIDILHSVAKERYRHYGNTIALCSATMNSNKVFKSKQYSKKLKELADPIIGKKMMIPSLC